MGSFIEINDTLQITKAQGFPEHELNYEKHLIKPFEAKDFKKKIFDFKNKEGIRFYHITPVRCFLVQNIDGKWLYWGLIHVLHVNHDYMKNTTSGKYKIIHIYTPEEMRFAHRMIDRNIETDYFN